jgi:hypothetical protein
LSLGGNISFPLRTSTNNKDCLEEFRINYITPSIMTGDSTLAGKLTGPTRYISSALYGDGTNSIDPKILISFHEQSST